MIIIINLINYVKKRFYRFRGVLSEIMKYLKDYQKGFLQSNDGTYRKNL